MLRIVDLFYKVVMLGLKLEEWAGIQTERLRSYPIYRQSIYRNSKNLRDP